MALILGNFYTKSFPSWPQVTGVYGLNLPNKGHLVDMFMPYHANAFQKTQSIALYKSRIYLIPWMKTNSYLFSMVTFMIYQMRLFFSLLKLNKENHYNIFQVRDEIFSGITVLLYNILLKKKYTFNYSFPFFEGLNEAYRNGEKVNKIQLLFFYIQDIILKNLLFKKSTYIFPISGEMLSELVKIGIPRDKMYPLTEGIEPTTFKINSNYNELKKILNINDNEFIISYVGSLSSSRGIEIIIDAFEMVLKDNPQTKLLLIGSGNDFNYLKNKVDRKNLNNSIIFTGQVSHDEVPNYISISNVCLSIIKPLKSFFVSSPCKLFEYMILGKPIIANKEIPEHERVISESNCGLLTEYNTNDIKNAINYSIKNYDNFKLLGENGKKWVIEKRTFSKISEQLEEIYLSLL